MNTAGWLLTENGRQPWIVQGLQLTSEGVSPSVSATMIWISLGVFIVLYGALAIVDWTLMVKYGRKQISPSPETDEQGLPEAAMTY
jgi:cytochrome d ubiquinol oxidase subunit I